LGKSVSTGELGRELERRFKAKLSRYHPQDPKLKEALMRIGVLIETEAKLNIRRKHIIDTGTLFNSIRYQLISQGAISGVEVGSYGVPYAAAHEFGFQGTVTVPTHNRFQTKAFGRPIKNPRSISVSTHSRRMNIRARPYLRPAFKKARQKIMDLIAEIVR
jgi:phage gpG-like protein